MKLADMDGKWERIEEEHKPLLVIGVFILRKDLDALKRLVEGEVPPRQRLRDTRKAIAYLMGDAIGLGFVLVMWSKIRLILEAVEFAPLYQGRSSNFREGVNLT